jgi:hypothetical protein
MTWYQLYIGVAQELAMYKGITDEGYSEKETVKRGVSLHFTCIIRDSFLLSTFVQWTAPSSNSLTNQSRYIF